MADYSKSKHDRRASGNQVDTLSEFQRTRKIILDLLEPILADAREQKDANPELWKIYIDNACERIEEVYRG